MQPSRCQVKLSAQLHIHSVCCTAEDFIGKFLIRTLYLVGMNISLRTCIPSILLYNAITLVWAICLLLKVRCKRVCSIKCPCDSRESMVTWPKCDAAEKYSQIYFFGKTELLWLSCPPLTLVGDQFCNLRVAMS